MADLQDKTMFSFGWISENISNLVDNMFNNWGIFLITLVVVQVH